MIIRIVLLIGIAAIAYLAFLRRNRLPIHIVLILSMLGIGVLLTLFPDYATMAANFVGVGRGVDLVAYVLDLVFLFTLLFYYTKFVELERQLTAVVRELAIVRAHHGPPLGPPSDAPPTVRPPTTSAHRGAH